MTVTVRRMIATWLSIFSPSAGLFVLLWKSQWRQHCFWGLRETSWTFMRSTGGAYTLETYFMSAGSTA
jgi:hypothetical protein